MNATGPNPTKSRPGTSHWGKLVAALLAALALSACAEAGGPPAEPDDADVCGPVAECEEPGRLVTQVRLDADAILAGMAHARARLGLQEDAAP
jgi:hypothetical protein